MDICGSSQSTVAAPYFDRIAIAISTRTELPQILMTIHTNYYNYFICFYLVIIAIILLYYYFNFIMIIVYFRSL